MALGQSIIRRYLATVAFGLGFHLKGHFGSCGGSRVGNKILHLASVGQRLRCDSNKKAAVFRHMNDIAVFSTLCKVLAATGHFSRDSSIARTHQRNFAGSFVHSSYALVIGRILHGNVLRLTAKLLIRVALVDELQGVIHSTAHRDRNFFIGELHSQGCLLYCVGGLFLILLVRSLSLPSNRIVTHN